MPTPQPFEPHIDQAVLDDLQRRLENIRWAPEFANDDWSYGANGAYLRALMDYWRDGFDWRAQEAKINAFSHYRVEVDGLPIHYIREPGKGPKPMPLILSHGWPWTFWDLKDIIRPLADPAAFGGDPADAFDVIVPSLPGFGFSSPLARPGMNFWRTADLWVELMTKVLGYERFAAQGGDWGALVTSQLGHRYADRLIGIHITTPIPLHMFSGERNWDLRGGDPLPADPVKREASLARQRKFASHVTVHVLDPQTLAWMAHDSPLALAAWLIERRRAWADCGGDLDRSFSKDDLLTNLTLYWATETFVTSVRYYAEAARHRWTPDHPRTPVVEAPTGISFFKPDTGPGPNAQHNAYYNLTFAREHATGGHFAPAESPQQVIDDVRATFRPLR